MDVDASPAPVEEIRALRALHRDEMACQIVHDSLHERGLSRPYLLRVGGEVVGYGSVFGIGNEPKETVDEFYVQPRHRGASRMLFRRLLEASSATKIQAQTNDPQLLLMLFDFAEGITRDRILFADGFTSPLESPGTVSRRADPADAERPFDGRPLGDRGSWLLEREGEIVAAGGVLFHYNPPYGDIYMEVAERHRRRGYGSYLVQELKRVTYEMEKVPAARCQADNLASRATLERAGMIPCGSILLGTVR